MDQERLRSRTADGQAPRREKEGAAPIGGNRCRLSSARLGGIEGRRKPSSSLDGSECTQFGAQCKHCRAPVARRVARRSGASAELDDQLHLDGRTERQGRDADRGAGVAAVLPEDVDQHLGRAVDDARAAR